MRESDFPSAAFYVDPTNPQYLCCETLGVIGTIAPDTRVTFTPAFLEHAPAYRVGQWCVLEGRVVPQAQAWEVYRANPAQLRTPPSVGAKGEFGLIERYFTYPNFSQWSSAGVGDDCALIDVGPRRIAVTTDMMAITTHFLPDCPPDAVGYKALAVNLSDLAAAGAEPRAFFLSLGLDEANETWLDQFSSGLMRCALEAGCALLGGDTTRTPQRADGGHTPKTISITAMGDLPAGEGLTRAGANVDDDIWVSGTLGDAYAGLKACWGHWHVSEEQKTAFLQHLQYPSARYQLGIAIRSYARAAADISDGLLADLGHILERSHVAATLIWDDCPRSEALLGLPEDQQREAFLSGGDDYELVFTAPSTARSALEQISRNLSLRLTRIGKIRASDSGDNLILRTKAGIVIPLTYCGFNHFANDTTT